MRKTSQDGGDSTSLSSMVDSDRRRSVGAAGIIKNTRNSLKRKVQNFSHESDDAVIEPLLKDKSDTSQGAKITLPKTKNESASSDNQVGSLIIANGFTDNPTKLNALASSVLNDKDIIATIKPVPTQVLIDIDCKPTTQNASPVIFTTAKIHAEEKSNQNDMKLATPIPIVSTAASGSFAGTIVNETANGIIRNVELKKPKHDKSILNSPDISSPIQPNEQKNILLESQNQTCTKIMTTPILAKITNSKNTFSNGTVKSIFNKPAVINFVDETSKDNGITTSVKTMAPVVSTSKLEQSVKAFVGGTGQQKAETVMDNLDRNKAAQTAPDHFALKMSDELSVKIVTKNKTPAATKESKNKGLSKIEPNKILSKQKSTTIDDSSFSSTSSSYKLKEKETQTSSIKSSSSEKQPAMKPTGAKSKDVPKKMPPPINPVDVVKKTSTTPKLISTSDVTKTKPLDSSVKNTSKKPVSLNKERSGVPEASTNQSGTKTSTSGTANHAIKKVDSTNKSSKNVEKKADKSSAKKGVNDTKSP